MELVCPLVSDWPQTIEASGRIVPWQESIVGAAIGDLRLEEVRVDVGDVVARGELLARFDAAVPTADFAMAEANVAQAEANAALAHEKAARARRLEGAGNLSQQDLLQFEAEEKANASQLAAARAQQQLQRLRLLHAEVRAPDDGVISARSATVGTVSGTGAELFRLIRRGRLEWHARVPAEELSRVAPGQHATVRLGRATVAGIVRQVSPVVDAGTLDGTVHVDLPDSAALRTGMFVSGTIEFPAAPALHVPESALVFRDGCEYVMLVDGSRRVHPTKVVCGRRSGQSVEILDSQLTVADQVVRSGGSFLNPGDSVAIAAAPTASAAPPVATQETGP